MSNTDVNRRAVVCLEVLKDRNEMGRLQWYESVMHKSQARWIYSLVAVIGAFCILLDGIRRFLTPLVVPLILGLVVILMFEDGRREVLGVLLKGGP
jgi:hypothetical protein